MTAYAAPVGPTPIIVLRHAEDKGQSSDEPLIEQGHRRADALAATAEKWAVRNGTKPYALFATSLHTVQTLKPTARKLGLSLRIMTKDSKFKAWVKRGEALALKKDPQAAYYPDAKDIVVLTKSSIRMADLRTELAKSEYAGKPVVICWVREEITELVTSFGYQNVPSWNRRKHKWAFDRFWVLDFAKDRKDAKGWLFDSEVNDIPQNLLPTDSYD